MTTFPYTWAWDQCSGCRLKAHKSTSCPAHCKGQRPAFAGRKGTRCRVLKRGAKGSVLIEFEDGFLAVASRRGLRKAKA